MCVISSLNSTAGVDHITKRTTRCSFFISSLVSIILLVQHLISISSSRTHLKIPLQSGHNILVVTTLCQAWIASVHSLRLVDFLHGAIDTDLWLSASSCLLDHTGAAHPSLHRCRLRLKGALGLYAALRPCVLGQASSELRAPR